MNTNMNASLRFGTLPTKGRTSSGEKELPKFEIVAHRGIRTLGASTINGPENTEPALMQAVMPPPQGLGVSVELDLQAISGPDGDGYDPHTDPNLLVIHHNFKTGEVFHLEGGDKAIRDLTKADLDKLRLSGEYLSELQRFNDNEPLKLGKGFANAKIPRAPDVIKKMLLASGNSHIYLEIKALEKGNGKLRDFFNVRQDHHNYVEKRVVQLFSDLANDPELQAKGVNPYERMTVISFSPSSLRLVKQGNNAIHTGWDCSYPTAAAMALVRKFAGVESILPSYFKTTPKVVAAAHDLRLRVLPYVEQKLSRAEEADDYFPKLLNWGVDGIVTNSVDLLQAELAKRQDRFRVQPHRNLVDTQA